MSLDVINDWVPPYCNVLYPVPVSGIVQYIRNTLCYFPSESAASKTHPRSIDPRFIGRSQDGRRDVSSWTRIASGLTSYRRSRTKRHTVRMTNSENIVAARQARVTHATCRQCTRVCITIYIYKKGSRILTDKKI